MAYLATPEQLASHLQQATVDTYTAEQSLNGASDAVRAACGWYIEQETVTDLVLDGWVPDLYLPTRRLTAVADILEDDVTLEVDEYEWTVAGRLRRLYGCWGRKVMVSFTHGWTTIPYGVNMATLRIAARIYNVTTGGLTSYTVDGVTETYSTSAEASAAGASVSRDEMGLLVPHIVVGV